MRFPTRVGLVLAVMLFCASGVASAAPIVVGTFNFTREACDTSVDEFCQDFEYFSITNDTDPADSLYGGLTFFADVALGDTAVGFFDFFGNGVLGTGQSAITQTADAGYYFGSATLAGLNFFGGNFADYGVLSLSGNLDPANSFATIVLDARAQPVPEPGTLLLLGVGVGAVALTRRRAA